MKKVLVGRMTENTREETGRAAYYCGGSSRYVTDFTLPALKRIPREG